MHDEAIYYILSIFVELGISLPLRTALAVSQKIVGLSL